MVIAAANAVAISSAALAIGEAAALARHIAVLVQL
jgi:hypothetical protein